MVDEEGRCLYSTGSENHTPYFEHMKKLIPGLDRQIPEKSGIVTQNELDIVTNSL